MQKFLLTVEDISLDETRCELHPKGSNILAEFRIRHSLNAGESRLDVCNEHLAQQLCEYSSVIYPH